MDTARKFVIVVANGTLFDASFTPCAAAFQTLRAVQDRCNKLLVVTKVDGAEQQEAVRQQMAALLPNVPAHHLLFCEQAKSIYSFVRQFDSLVDLVVDTFQESYDETAKFYPGKYHLVQQTLDRVL
ncbi:hypothetical protein SS50377_27021 [Spironucleus salmonicida]|uniref:Uncharacterized protein n=1 Tax=Spironucleus salmonicida TaxID=348837 RepID=V6LUZ7_9EUKA|nr:hypothetical protein SS50377_27014 [Spironucleus salmonicida]KAH0570734.1 hypothetical protein SS50377_27021 [Spironucleus salmonicida]|eukprot:EST47526.1 hypothetical protein SS50377_12510 [Spironucleus salmonicida]